MLDAEALTARTGPEDCWRPGWLASRLVAVRASAGLEEAPITGAEGLHVLETIFAFYEAVRTGRAQSV